MNLNRSIDGFFFLVEKSCQRIQWFTSFAHFHKIYPHNSTLQGIFHIHNWPKLISLNNIAKVEGVTYPDHVPGSVWDKYTGFHGEKYIQLKMFAFEKVWNKFKQNFHSCKNISLSSFGSIYWLNILGYYLLFYYNLISNYCQFLMVLINRTKY